MAKQRTINDPVLTAQALEMHSKGATQREIADALGFSKTTISLWGKRQDPPLTWENGYMVEAAARQVVVNFAQRRQELADKMLTESSKMLDELNGKYEVFNFGGKDNTFESQVLDSVPIDVKLKAIQSAGITFDKVTRIVDNPTDGVEEAKGTLDGIFKLFVAWTENQKGEPRK